MTQIKLDIEQHGTQDFGVRFPWGTEFVARNGHYRWGSAESAQTAVTAYLQQLREAYLSAYSPGELEIWAGLSGDELRARLELVGPEEWAEAVMDAPEPEPAPELHGWEMVEEFTRRMRVPSGWLYQTDGSGPVFVPDPSP